MLAVLPVRRGARERGERALLSHTTMDMAAERLPPASELARPSLILRNHTQWGYCICHWSAYKLGMLDELMPLMVSFIRFIRAAHLPGKCDAQEMQQPPFLTVVSVCCCARRTSDSHCQKSSR